MQRKATSVRVWWSAQHRTCNGDQVCSKCLTCSIPRESIRKAVRRVAATQARVAMTAAEEKKARVIADVKAAIAERKRNREEEIGQTKDALPPAKQCRQDSGTERNTDGHAEMSCTQQDAASATEKVTRSANAAKVARKGKNRRVCGKQFYVKDCIVSKDTRCHPHTCPVCATVVWSAHASGRIACRHDTPSGQRCRTNQWYVPDQDVKKQKKRK